MTKKKSDNAKKTADRSNGPLSGMLVLEFAAGLAGPFAATLLADFGAEVVKIERPGKGDFFRDVDPSGGAWWGSMARGKRSVALNLNSDTSRPIVQDLVKKADVLIDSFRPGVLERLDYGPDVLWKWNPNLIILRISGYGQTGPYSKRPGFGKAAEAFAGLLHMTGFPDGPPVYVGFAIGDMCSGLMGAYGVLLSWIARERGMAKGQVVDLALYETILRLMDYLVPVATSSNLRLERVGNRQPMGFAPSGIFKARDGRWVIYSAATADIIRRIITVTRGEEYAKSPKFETLAASRNHLDEIDDIVADLCIKHTAEDAVRILTEAEAVAAVVSTPSEIVSDPHILARKSIVAVEGQDGMLVNVMPSLSETPGRIRAPGPKILGGDGVSVLQEILGYDESTIAKFIKERAIEVPPEASKGPPIMIRR